MANEQGGMKKFFSNLFWPLTSTLEFLQKYFKGIVLLLLLLVLLGSMQREAAQKPNLMSIKLTGTILDSKKMLDQIEEAQKSNIKGVLFIIDSPGGAVAPSIEISRAIKRLRAKKPVVVYAAGTLASGSYYSAIWANKIIANPGSIVGSIGVIFESANIKKLLDTVGIEPQIVKEGKYKEVGTPLRPWKEYEKAEIKKVLDDTYAMFKEDVAKARKLDLNASETWAEAHIFTARQAKAVGLIDRVGTIDMAKKEVEKLSGVKKPVWKREDKFEKLMERLTDETSSKLATLLLGPKLF